MFRNFTDNKLPARIVAMQRYLTSSSKLENKVRNFTDEELTTAIIPFNRYLASNDEQKALISLTDFILSYGASGLVQIYEKLLYRGTENKTQYWVTPLFHAVSNRFELIVIKLLECGVPVDNGMMCDTNKNYYNKSPLMEASYRGYIPIAKALIDNDANLLHVSGSGTNCLMYAANTEMFDFLLLSAQNNKCDTELVMMKDNEDHYIFEVLPVTLKAAVFQKIFSYFDINNTPEISKMIHRARQAYFCNPPESKEFDELCLTLKKAQPKHDNKQMVEYSNRPNFYRSTSSRLLFGKWPAKITDTKDKALEMALAEYYALLNHPSKCMRYLQFLNRDFLRYNEETRAEKFPSLDSTSFEFKIIDATYYPIPKPGYIGIKKHSALQEFLILLFRKYDLAQQAYKWSGFIPKYLADEMLKQGDFVTEDTMGTGLFHNKLAHMLQQAILIYAIEDREITLEYSDMNGTHKISIQDILNAMLTKIMFGRSGNGNLWMPIRDHRNFEEISFSDPHRLGSVIMYYGQNADMSLGIRALSDYLIDTFCKGFKKLLNAYQIQPEYSNLTTNDFVDKLNDLESQIFITPQFLIDKSIQRAERKKQLIQKGEGFAAIMKNYNPNESFEAKRFNF